MFSDDERMPCEMEARQFNEESEYLIPWLKRVILGQLDLDPVSNLLSLFLSSYTNNWYLPPTMSLITYEPSKETVST